LICLSFLIFSCQTAPTGSVDMKSAIWNLDTKAQITDKTNQTTNNVTIDIFLKKNEMIRMEITALMGYEVGSLLMNRSSLQYAVHPQKYFIQGPLAGRTLKPLFKQEIDPVILWSLIHNQSLKSRGFQCTKTATLIEQCKNNLATVEIEQRGEIDSNGVSIDGQKKVTIENTQLKFIWIFKSMQVAEKASVSETFNLVKPKEYKLITIK
jgi:Domain of unknown function (DUF4292)